MIKTILAIFITVNSYAAEVDNFTGRYIELEDATERINIEANRYLKIAVDRANRSPDFCKEKKLYKVMRKYFRNNYLSKFTPWLYKTDEFEKINITLDESIYKEFSAFEAPAVAISNRYFTDTFAKSLNINSHRIGTDKFEHFFGSGYAYFRRFYLWRQSLWKAVRIGLRAEHSILGATSTGVISYADMVANFNGMRFWNSVLAKREDIFQQKIGPYVKCDGKKWVIENPIDLSIFVDHGWDEAINCSKFRNKKLLIKVKRSISELSNKYQKDMSCPLIPEEISKVKKKYDSIGIGSWIINPKGHQILRK